MWWLWMSLAWAERPWVSEVGDARSVVVLRAEGDAEDAALCRDDGAGGDTSPGDGVFTCGELPPWVGGPRVVALIDGARGLPAEGGSPEGPSWGLVARGRAAALVSGPPPAGEAGAPRPPVPAFVLEIDRGPVVQAPVVLLSGAGGRVELTCRDDGSFPARAQNDGVATCAGPAPGYALEVTLRGGAEAERYTARFPEGAAVLKARLTAEGLAPADWAMLSRPKSQDAGPAGASPQDGGPPQGAPGGPTGRPPSWSLPFSLALCALTALATAAFTTRRRAGLPAHLRPARAPHAPKIVVIPEVLSDLVEARARLGVVVVLTSPETPLPDAAPGPVLRATSADALDLAEALHALRRVDPLRTISVVLAADRPLTSPGEVGLTAHERLLGRAPDGVTVFVCEGPLTAPAPSVSAGCQI